MSAVIHNFPGMTVMQWAEHGRARGLAERTISEQAATVTRIADELATDPVALTAEQLTRWFATKHLAPGSRATYRTALRAWFDFLILQDIRPDDPTRKLGRVKLPRYQPHPIRTEHLSALLSSGLRSRTRSMVLLGAYQGFRASEIAQIRGEHVDRISKELFVRGNGGFEATIPLHPVIDLESRRYPNRGYWFPSYSQPSQPMRDKSVSATLGQAMARTGIPGSAHSLRHWFASQLLDEGVDVRVVQELMRHQSLQTTAVYTKVNLSRQRVAIEHLPRVA